ncbi:NAD-dependent formate dehydrogenase subunit delta [Alcaligenes faecalis subsp. faecalis NCIB 8687]|jgi:formate dehydrogenase subunit delta|uniref:formate dehydrogenase subunit delta n=1 Tax=unclassified Alcaligenes TaxID=259357 RepID=UPI000269E799|nr:NAD-dependent formate dehydrogenase subunit delta [Alcaligenes faecalis subsp. faecalis NCIB 8687]QBH20057.1 formate dehydrogenase [Alcaligenes faecalis]HRK85762.1 formate dehydrogenase subunit delta [Alcaligenes faecalis]
MNIVPLIPMANQIGQFFETLSNREQGLREIADHIQKFWDPRMRRSLLDFVEQHPNGKSEDGELTAIVLQAVLTHRQQLEPRQP